MFGQLELAGGHTASLREYERPGDIKCQFCVFPIVRLRLSLTGARHKLSRSSMGWSFENGLRSAIGHRPATIRSLWKLGLLDANFNDPRGVGTLAEVREVQNLDGARLARSPDVPQLFVWTNARGVKLLQDNGLLSGQSGATINH